mgnify:CR=1 FL=1
MSDMNALELADCIEDYGSISTEAAAMLRRQHEAIKVLRDAITKSQECVSWQHTAMTTRDRLEKALTDTENLT